ncbi:DEAD/DEAH box helicase [Rhodoferax sp.]|uniref:DEAD/DEAH box helicase n=1 Tax=Rhodoferax sp. TaxID=50421 RepID=UPI0034545E36
MIQNSPLSPGLWFKPQSLQPMADAGAWTRGLMLYRSQKVLGLDIEPMQDHWLLLGEVQGSQREPYEVSIEMALMPDGQVDYWDSECECPVGSQCKHGVALMLKAAYQGLQLLGGNAPYPMLSPPSPEQVETQRLANLARAQESARLEAEAQLLRWLQELDRASGAATKAAHGDPAIHGAREDIRPEQFLYLLTVVGAHSPTPRLQMEAVVSYPKVTGGWAKPKAIKSAPYKGQAVYDQASDADHQVLQLMRAMPDSSRFSYNFNSSALPSGQAGLIALQQAASTGRLLLDDGKGGAGLPLQWGPPQRLSWHWQEVPNPQALEPSWTLRGQLADSHAKLCLNSPPLYLDAALGLCGPVQAEGIPTAQLDVLLKAPPLKPSALQKHQVALMQRLGKLPLPPVLQQLTTLQGITPSACLHLALTPPENAPSAGLIQAQLRFDYAGHRGWWAGQGSTVLIESAAGRVLLQRDAEAELDAITRLYDLGLMSAEKGLFGIPGDGPQQDWLHWADNGFSVLRDAGFEVTLDAALNHWITHADTLEVQLQPEGEEEATSPWFDLSLGMEINGQRHNILPWLPDLIAAAAASPLDPETGLPNIPPFVYLPSPNSQGFIRLPTDTLKPWMAALLELVNDRDHDFTGASLKLSRLDALRTGAALGEGAVWDGAQTLRDMVQQLSGQSELPQVPVPASVQASLRPYQQQGVNWLQFLRQHRLGGILADDMGLGKTLQTLVHIQIEKDAGRLSHPALIIAPVSLMGNWQRETERFCPQLRCLVLHGKERHAVADTMDQFDVVIAPYSLLQRDRERWLEAQWHLVVLDEAQNIKNASTNAAQVAGLLQTRHRLCLSGTPMENHLGEIWSLFHFLMPGFLGSQARFKELFRNPIEKQGDPERLHQLRARITPFMLRRTKAVVANELPPKVETVMRVELSGQQADLYETIRLGMEKTVREALTSKGLAKSQITILDALLKLRQVCCDPKLLKMEAAQKVKTSAKLEQLMEMLPEMLAEGRRILLFSQFTSMLTLIEAELKKCKIPWVKLTGQSQKRDALIEQFTSGQVPLFLISLKAGGVGLNLPQADTVIHYDPWWNPAVEAQATDRAHRIGQTQSVFVYKMVAQGTIEERILALQERKAALSESMYSGSVGRKEPLFSEGDLAELLKPLSI